MNNTLTFEYKIMAGCQSICKIDTDNPPELNNILLILKHAKPELHVWIKLSMAYAKKLDEKSFSNLLELSLEYGSTEYSGVEVDKLKIQQLLSAYYAKKGNNAYENNDTKEALLFYTKALSWNPKSPAIKVAISRCYLRLGNKENALQYCGQALDIDSQRIDALSDMGILKVQCNDVKGGVELLNKSYAMDSKNPGVLNALADYHFTIKEYNQSLDMASQALDSTDDQLLISESYFIMAKVYHVQENYDKALKYYNKACDNAPEINVEALFNLGKMHLYKGDLAKAIQCLEKILTVQPNDISTMKFLGMIYTISPINDINKAMAETYLKKITEKSPGDADSWNALAQLWEGSNPEKALIAYSKTIEIMRGNKKYDHILYKVLNNAATLNQKLGKFDECRHLIKESLIELNKIVTPDPDCKSHKVLIEYNLAKVHEELQEFNTAKELYKTMVENHPNYINSYLRLGYMAQQSNLFDEANDWYEKALKIDKQNINALASIGKCQYQKKNFNLAKKSFETILRKPLENENIFAYLGIASSFLQFVQHSNLPEDKKTKYINTSLHVFKTVLKMDPTNRYAINGIGCILGQQVKYLSEAKVLFELIYKFYPNFENAQKNIEIVKNQIIRPVSGVLEENVKLDESGGTISELMDMITSAFFVSKTLDCGLNLGKSQATSTITSNTNETDENVEESDSERENPRPSTSRG